MATTVLDCALHASAHTRPSAISCLCRFISSSISCRFFSCSSSGVSDSPDDDTQRPQEKMKAMDGTGRYRSNAMGIKNEKRKSLFFRSVSCLVPNSKIKTRLKMLALVIPAQNNEGRLRNYSLLSTTLHHALIIFDCLHSNRLHAPVSS